MDTGGGWLLASIASQWETAQAEYRGVLRAYAMPVCHRNDDVLPLRDTIASCCSTISTLTIVAEIRSGADGSVSRPVMVQPSPVDTGGGWLLASIASLMGDGAGGVSRGVESICDAGVSQK